MNFAPADCVRRPRPLGCLLCVLGPISWQPFRAPPFDCLWRPIGELGSDNSPSISWRPSASSRSAGAPTLRVPTLGAASKWRASRAATSSLGQLAPPGQKFGAPICAQSNSAGIWAHKLHSFLQLFFAAAKRQTLGNSRWAALCRRDTLSGWLDAEREREAQWPDDKRGGLAASRESA